MRINSNIASLQAQTQLQRTTKALSRALERLSSGKRINSAKDDASGLAISQGLEAQVRGLGASTRGLNQAMGYLQTADGVLQTQTELVQRMKELALQASNGIISAVDRSNLDTELQSLLAEFNRLTDQASFNGQKILDGSLGTIELQVGTQKGQSFSLNLGDTKPSSIFSQRQTLGTGTFNNRVTIDLGGSGWQALYTDKDFDGDGKTDIASYDPDNGIAHIRYSRGDGTFNDVSISGVDWLADASDLNGDGKIDVIVNAGNVSKVYLQGGQGQFTLTSTFNNYLNYGIYDINGDGKKDLMLYTGTAWLSRLSLGNGSFGAAQTLSNFGSNNLNYAQDLNGDGRLDFIIGNFGAYGVRLSNGDGTFSVGTTLNENYIAMVPKDLTGDGVAEIIMTDAQNTSLFTVYRGNSSGTYSFSQTFNGPAGGSTSIIATDDLNRDGRADLLLYNYVTRVAEIWTQNGSGQFSKASTFYSVSSSYPNSSKAFDFDRDGDNDLLFADAVYFNNGSGTFTKGQTLSLAAYNTIVTDINGDGILDIFDPRGGSFTSYIGLGDGTFRVAQSDSIPATAYFAYQGDYNGDGVIDFLVSVDDGSDPVLGLLIQNTEVTESVPTISLKTQADAQSSLKVLSDALDNLSGVRANISAQANRLDSAISSNLMLSENLETARSRIQDADIAEESSELVKQQILQQAAAAVTSQANLALQAVLSLLKF